MALFLLSMFDFELVCLCYGWEFVLNFFWFWPVLRLFHPKLFPFLLFWPQAVLKIMENCHQLLKAPISVISLFFCTHLLLARFHTVLHQKAKKPFALKTNKNDFKRFNLVLTKETFSSSRKSAENLATAMTLLPAFVTSLEAMNCTHKSQLSTFWSNPESCRTKAWWNWTHFGIEFSFTATPIREIHITLALPQPVALLIHILHWFLAIS